MASPAKYRLSNWYLNLRINTQMCKLFQEYNTLAKLLWVALLYVVSAGPVFILFVINNLLYNFKNPSSAPNTQEWDL
jgi:hypothetical protein